MLDEINGDFHIYQRKGGGVMRIQKVRAIRARRNKDRRRASVYTGEQA